MFRLLFIPLLFGSITAFSQIHDQKAIALLDQVSAKTKASGSLKAEFSYTMENKQAKINEVKTGSLLVQGDKYRLTIAGQVVICDGKTIWTYIKESNEVQVNNVNDKDESLTPSKLLTSYNENYKPKIVKDKNQTDANIETVELTPKASKTFTKAILTIDKAKLQVRSFMLFDKNGNIFTYKVTKFLTNIPITATDFSFNPKQYPGVEVIDMR
jgi:outer membrane lipoprotein carrier protein